MTHCYIVEQDGVVVYNEKLGDTEVQNLIRFGSVVSVFRQTVGGIQYADVDEITHEIEWKFVEIQEEA